MSHNSGAYQIHPLNTVYNRVPKCLLRRNVLCQSKTIYEQLSLGVDVLDLRVMAIGNLLYVAHTVVCVELSIIFDDIQRYNREFPEQVITACVKPDYFNRSTMDYDAETIFKRMCDEYFKDLPNVHILYNPTHLSPSKFSHLSIDSGWKNTNKISELFINSPSRDYKIMVAAFYLTQIGWYDMVFDSIEKKSTRVYSKLIDLVKSITNQNCVAIDYVSAMSVGLIKSYTLKK